MTILPTSLVTMLWDFSFCRRARKEISVCNSNGFLTCWPVAVSSSSRRTTSTSTRTSTSSKFQKWYKLSISTSKMNPIPWMYLFNTSINSWCPCLVSTKINLKKNLLQIKTPLITSCAKSINSISASLNARKWSQSQKSNFKSILKSKKSSNKNSYKNIKNNLI